MNDYDSNETIKIDLGRFKFYVPLRYIPHYLLEEYEPVSSKIIFLGVPRPGTFLDVGGHLGYYSLLAASISPKVSVKTIEPVGANLEIINKNRRINRFQNIEVFPVAASDKEETKTIFLTEAAGECGFYNNHLAPIIDKTKVKSYSLDKLLKTPHVDFIKIDVEGHEIAVLKGLKKTLQKNPNLKMLIECNPNAQTQAGSGEDKLINFISRLGFKIFMIDENANRLFPVGKDFTAWIELSKHNQYINLFCTKGTQPNFIVPSPESLQDKTDEISYVVSGNYQEVSGKRVHQLNLLAEKNYYRKRFIKAQTQLDTGYQSLSDLESISAELHKIKSSKLWKIFYIYKNPVLCFESILRQLRTKFLPPQTHHSTKLHLGCGNIILPNWLNIDIDAKFDPENIMVLDLSKPFPFSDNSVDRIFVEHLIECFSKEQGMDFLKECFRVLKPGSPIRLGFSDFEKLFQAYSQKDNSYKQQMLTDMQPLLTKEWDEFFSDMLYSWDRKYYYSQHLLIKFFKLAGYSKIRTKAYNESDFGFRHDSRKLPDNTYIEACKRTIK